MPEPDSAATQDSDQHHLRATERAIHLVFSERLRQEQQWGKQDHDPFTYLAILVEEVGELAKAAAENRWRQGSKAAITEEAVHVSAVAIAIVECMLRDDWQWEPPQPHVPGLKYAEPDPNK